MVFRGPFNPLGKWRDHVYRVEFQQRGSAHIHMLAWVEDAPQYGSVDEKQVIEYIDQHVTCSGDIPDDQAQYLNMQKHRHSKSCRKKGKAICRYGFPVPPMPETEIIEPYEGEQREEYESLFERVRKALNDIKDDSDSLSFDEFLAIVDCSYEDYLKAIQTSVKGPKVFLRRTTSEIRINPYMRHLLDAWCANHDIQYVLDPYACAIYITNYISKCAKGMSTLLHNACKEARQGNDDLRKQVRFIGNQFLNATEICAQEAVYLALQLPLIKKTRQVTFINSSPPEDRTRLLKSEDTLKELSDNSVDIFSSNDITRYAMRPKQLENWCLADYVSELNIQYPQTKERPLDPFADNCDDEFDAIDNENDLHNNEDDNGLERQHHHIDVTLRNGIKIKTRAKPRVIRYVRFSEHIDKENFSREQLFLFHPWRNESTDLLDNGKYETYSAHYESKKQFIGNIRKKYDFKCKGLDEAIAQVESDNLNENANAQIAPINVQQECDDETVGSTPSGQFGFYDPKRTMQQQKYDIGYDIHAPSKVSDELIKGCIPDADYLDLVRQLNQKQREFFIHVMQSAKTSTEPLRIFLTGGAGVGKSVVIRALYQALHRYYISQSVDDLDHVRVEKCAPTGTAAYNIEGTTIHHAFAIPVQQNFTKLSPEKHNTLHNKYRQLKFVIVDEVSLISNDLFRRMNLRLQDIRRDNRPFGGLHILLVGDLFQLEPVSYTWIYKNLQTGHTPLATNLWQEYFTMYELTEIMRQKDDQEFAQLLNRLREGNQTADDLAQLRNKVIRSDNPNYPFTAPHMFRTNAEVNISMNLHMEKQLLRK